MKFKYFVQKITRVETETDIIKKRIINLSKGLDCSELLAYLKAIPHKQMEIIKKQFFYITSKKFSKNQSIENYGRFLKILIDAFGIDNSFLKNFYYNERDSDEVEALIGYIRKWDCKGKEELDIQT